MFHKVDLRVVECDRSSCKQKYFEVRSVFFDQHNQPIACSIDATQVVATSIDGLRAELTKISLALKEPILKESQIGAIKLNDTVNNVKKRYHNRRSEQE